MSQHLAPLQQAIQSSLTNRPTTVAAQALVEFPRLKEANEHLYNLFVSAKSEPVPPLEKRRAALARFSAHAPLTRQEWRMVLSGLSDNAIGDAQVLDSPSLFARVVNQLQGELQSNQFRRREWFSLCFSYFNFSSENPQSNPQWLTLRQQIVKGYDIICRQQVREKEWMRVVNSQKELFTDNAGAQLATQLFNGQITNLSHLQVIAQIPNSSWLWSKIMAYVCKQIELLKDNDLQHYLPSLIELAKSQPIYRDRIFAACLTRYSKSAFRDVPHLPLKTAAFEAWGSPQLRSRNNVWLHHVEEPVTRMVMGWFARQDLEHFFSLLQGTAQVDTARLAYWLRFVSQMSYTRVILGADARSNGGTDFTEFRKANKGRLGYLDGGTSADNAVIMQIGNYYFVEFSKTGNACYVHKANSRFNPDKQTLHLSRELKDTSRDVFVAKYNHTGPWQFRFDQELLNLGIRPGGALAPGVSDRPPPPRPAQGAADRDSRVHRFPAPTASPTPTSPGVGKIDVEKDFMFELNEILKDVDHYIQDHRSTGGGFHVFLTRPDPRTAVKLKRLGFKERYNDPLRFWVS